MAFTEFYCQSGGSNLNAGSTIANAAEFTYTSQIIVGGWNAATGVFTVASGNPSGDGVAVGNFASVYITSGAVSTGFVGRVTAVSATTITVSLTAKSGTTPITDALGGTTIKIGGAWQGPNGAVGFPFGFINTAQQDASGNRPRVNFKTGTYAITSGVTHANNGIWFQGYTTAPGDGGKATLDGGTSAIHLLTLSAGATVVADMIFANNGTTGANIGLLVTVGACTVFRCVAHDIRGNGFQGSGVGGRGAFIECEAYSCNTSNTANSGGFGFYIAGMSVVRCISHNNAGSNNNGFFYSEAIALINCIADSNGLHGFFFSGTNTGGIVGCSAYGNGGDGIRVSATTGQTWIESCSLTNNGGWGVNITASTWGCISNCGFGSGAAVNTLGTTSQQSSIAVIGSVIYASDVTPWVDPANGDFRINLAAAKGAGRGAFTQTQSGYAGTIGYPDIGAAQHQDTGGRRPQVRTP